MSDTKQDNGEGFFLGLMWLIFGWIPWVISINIYMGFKGVESIPANDPVNISLFVIGYLTFPIFAFIVAIMIGLFIEFCSWLIRLLY